MTLLKDAIILAANMHDGQYDKGGHPYILHPLRLMLNCETDEERIVAVLHDIVEDTEITIGSLGQFTRFSADVIEAIDCLTRRKDEPYMKFIDRVKTNNLATKIKILDLKDNCDTSRLKEVTDVDRKRINKYLDALEVLIEDDNSSYCDEE